MASVPSSSDEPADLNLFASSSSHLAHDQSSVIPPAVSTNTATAKVLEKLLDRPAKPSPFKQVLQREPPPFPLVSDEEDGDGLGLDLGSPGSPPQPLQPGQRVTF